MTANNEFILDITRSNSQDENKENQQLQFFYIIKEIYTTEHLFRSNMQTLCKIFNDDAINLFDKPTQIKLRKLLAPFKRLAEMDLNHFDELKKFSESTTGKVTFNSDYLSFITQQDNWENLIEAALNCDSLIELVKSNKLSDNDKKLFKEFSDQLTALDKGSGIDSYIIQAVQRPPRYMLLLIQAKNTTANIELKNNINTYFDNVKDKIDKTNLEVATIKDTNKLLAAFHTGKTKEIKKSIKNIRKAMAVTLKLDHKKKENRKKTKKYAYEIYNIAMEQRQFELDRKTKKIQKIEKKVFSSLKKEEKQEIKERVNPTLMPEVAKKRTFLPAKPMNKKRDDTAGFLNTMERTLETHHVILPTDIKNHHPTLTINHKDKR